jgi:GNAT superfamily N-acetyltransferase
MTRLFSDLAGKSVFSFPTTSISHETDMTASATHLAGLEITIAETLDDYRLVMPLLRASTQGNSQHSVRPGIGAMASLTRHGGAGPHTGCVLLARIGGEAVGCLTLYVAKEGQAKLTSLYVVPPRRLLGIERKLIGFAFDVARSWNLKITG